MRQGAPEARAVNPHPAQLYNAAPLFFILRLGCIAWRRLIREEEAIVACKLFEAYGEEEGQGDDDEYFAARWDGLV